MEKIKFVIDELDVEEICLSIIGDYCKDEVRVETSEEDSYFKSVDIVIIKECDTFIDKIYGRRIKNKFYFARHEFIDKQPPQIDYYDEFFSDGTIMM